MSFITKRERVFNEYDLFDLPARNEGKLKAYASCTDARAWSHFCSDKTEHLVEIIKRNNETCRPKYVPTSVIVDTLMVAKNTEIGRLKRRVEEFEQMLAAYDQLELTCEQKCEIANAHAAIKAANKELDDMCLELDLSGFTEGIDSEGFQTGKSKGDEMGQLEGNQTERYRGDDWTFQKEPVPEKASKSNQMELCTCDIGTSVHDPRIDEMQDTIITKDAKLSAMQNTIAVMENDVCEPYYIYAHIYTALEKIFGILCQNDKYKHYLDLLTAGKDTRSIDIKGKILFKLKVFEKFCIALIAPCSQDSYSAPQECSCYRTEIVTHVETAFAITSAELKTPNLDDKRSQLVADIMENNEMKEIMSKECISLKTNDDDENFEIDSNSIDTDNINRLKNLQTNYDDLVICYENLKYEKDCLFHKCQKYGDLEHECQCLQNQLTEYNQLWKEKEHYRKRSDDLDLLKEKYLILSEETSNLETQLKAESEINAIKSNTISELRSNSIALEKKINDLAINTEKEKNNLICKLKEYECKMLCQEQQIKTLSNQIDKLLEPKHMKIQGCEDDRPVELLNEIESLKEEINKYKLTLIGSEEEKQQLQEEYQSKLDLINELKMNIEDWKSSYEKIIQRSLYFETSTKNCEEEINTLQEYNKVLTQDVEEKRCAIENLRHIVENKSQEANILMDKIEYKTKENRDIHLKLQKWQNKYENSMIALENEKKHALSSIRLARKESQESILTPKNVNSCSQPSADILENLTIMSVESNISKNKFGSDDNEQSSLVQEIQALHDVNKNNIQSLQEENSKLRKSLDFYRIKNEMLNNKSLEFEHLSEKFQKLKEAHDKLLLNKNNLDSTIHINKTESRSLMDLLKLKTSDDVKENFLKLHEAYHRIMNDNNDLQAKISKKDAEIFKCLHENNQLLEELNRLHILEDEFNVLKNNYDTLLSEKDLLQADFDTKTQEFNNLHNNLENKIEENRDLLQQMEVLQASNLAAKNHLELLQNNNLTVQTNLDAVKKESANLIDKLKEYENLRNEFVQLKEAYLNINDEKQKLEETLNKQSDELKKVKLENQELDSESHVLLAHNNNLEKALINARNGLNTVDQSLSPHHFYDNIKAEIEDIKAVKLSNQKEIRSLMDKLEESDNIILYLREDVSARDDKISTLQNYINELEDEVKRLHTSLSLVIDRSEQIRNDSYETIDQSLQKMEAHHSKATHNIKMELVKLQNENVKLEKQLSTSKLITVATNNDKQKYISQIEHLQNEKEQIISEIRHLESMNLGDSSLSSDNNSIRDVLNTIKRINRYLDSKKSKSMLLEQTLLKVQTSSQVLLNKADEAKYIIEKEKQKIINEKEEAVNERNIMEKRLADLKRQLQEQTIRDRIIIKDLESELMNRQLIIDEIERSRKEHILSLEDELQSLQTLYKDAMEKIKDLEESMQTMTKYNNKNIKIIEKINKDLTEKSNEIEELQKITENLNNESTRSIETQVWYADKHRDIESQTEKQTENKDCEVMCSTSALQKASNNVSEMTEMLSVLSKIKDDENKIMKPLHKTYKQNEVQILTANLKPTYEFGNNQLNNDDMQSKQSSNSYIIEDIEYEKLVNSTENKLQSSPETNTKRIECTYENFTNYTDIIDIYQIDTTISNSSRYVEDHETAKSTPYVTSVNSDPITITSHETTKNLHAKEYYIIQNQIEQYNVFPDKSIDKNVFVIYTDSSKISNKIAMHNETCDTKENLEICRESLTAQQPEEIIKLVKHRVNNIPLNETLDINEHKNSHKRRDVELHKTHTKKPSIKINLPRVANISKISITSDSDGISLDSYIKHIYTSPKQTNTNLETKNTVHEEMNVENNENCYNNIEVLSSRGIGIDEDMRSVFESKQTCIENYQKRNSDLNLHADRSYENPIQHNNIEKQRKKIDGVKKMKRKLSNNSISPLLKNSAVQLNNNETPTDFRLGYILNALQHQVNPIKIDNNTKEILRKNKSDECFHLQRSIHEPSECRTSNTFSPLKTSINKSISEISSNDVKRKTFSNCGVLVKSDEVQDYENKIQKLTQALENIEKHYKHKIEIIKDQYDMNIKSIINEHNQGVESMQSLHEETLQDIIKIHENEVESLRTMSIEAMRKAEKLEKDNKLLRSKFEDTKDTYLDYEPTKIPMFELKKHKYKSRFDPKILTKTDVEAFNVKPKSRSHGPCTCSLDVNITEALRSIFDQVDVEQRKMAEHNYLKYIADKLLKVNVEALDDQELAFLHLKVCRTWKSKSNRGETLQKRINLENAVIDKQRQAQKHLAELDRKVAEERRKLEEVREAVCRSVNSRACSPEPLPPAEKDLSVSTGCNLTVKERRSAGDLMHVACVAPRPKRWKNENRAVLAKLDVEERKHHDDYPTRLRRHDRPSRVKK